MENFNIVTEDGIKVVQGEIVPLRIDGYQFFIDFRPPCWVLSEYTTGLMVGYNEDKEDLLLICELVLYKKIPIAVSKSEKRLASKGIEYPVNKP